MHLSSLEWDFPLPRCHTGIPLGNGVQGLLIWGEDKLCITIARAGFWVHRHGSQFRANATYREVKRIVDARDEAALCSLFVNRDEARGPERPFQIGGGRLEIAFPGGFRPLQGRVYLAEGKVEIILENPKGETASLWISQAMGQELAWIEGFKAPALQGTEITLYPAWDYLAETLRQVGIEPPRCWAEGDEGGFLQTLPEDDPLAVDWRKRDGTLVLGTALGADAEKEVRALVATADLEEAGRAAREWWLAYWADVPKLELPDVELQHAYLLGLFKQAGLSTPGGVAATLQGPWMEEDRIPPWSNDYHFNINVQLVYGSVMPSNRLDHFAPLWDLIRAWFPTLRENGEQFFERKGAMMLPHAVDDRCQVIGSFWTGTIDHACSAWMAQMAWLHYRYAMDESILREIAWPLLVGAFEGYWAMLERMEDGKGGWRFSIPLSVSPEYNGSSLNACGRDASFQLAALHCVAAILPKAAAVLGELVDARWEEVSRHLPPYTIVEGNGKTRIGLWEGQDLAESHRHHAHLASIWPFATLEPLAPEHWEIVGRSMRHWGVMGAGKWTGWCLPWASILCTRCGLPDAAVAWLKWWQQVFTNVGHGTLHDPDFGGAGGSWSDGVLDKPGFERDANFKEIMQMDAAMAVVTAILDLLVQSRDETITVLSRLPKHWRDFRFSGIRTEGAFFVGAEVVLGKVKQISVRAEKGGVLRLRHPLGEGARLQRAPCAEPLLPGLLVITLEPGEEVLLFSK